jgi:hypothetical protein
VVVVVATVLVVVEVVAPVVEVVPPVVDVAAPVVEVVAPVVLVLATVVAVVDVVVDVVVGVVAVVVEVVATVVEVVVDVVATEVDVVALVVEVVAPVVLVVAALVVVVTGAGHAPVCGRQTSFSLSRSERAGGPPAARARRRLMPWTVFAFRVRTITSVGEPQTALAPSGVGFIWAALTPVPFTRTVRMLAGVQPGSLSFRQTRRLKVQRPFG